LVVQRKVNLLTIPTQQNKLNPYWRPFGAGT